jgi:glycine cleavage system aminomethyltransferase T
VELAPRRFGHGAAAQAAVAKVHALIARRDRGGIAGYDLYVDRDLGVYLWRSLLEAGAPLGLWPVGRDAEGELS